MRVPVHLNLRACATHQIMYFQLKKNHVHRFFLSSSNLQKISIFCQQDKKLSYLSGDRVRKNV